MTKVARRQGNPDVIRYYFKGKNTTKPMKIQNPSVAMQASVEATPSGSGHFKSSVTSSLLTLVSLGNIVKLLNTIVWRQSCLMFSALYYIFYHLISDVSSKNNAGYTISVMRKKLRAYFLAE